MHVKIENNTKTIYIFNLLLMEVLLLKIRHENDSFTVKWACYDNKTNHKKSQL